MKTGIGQKIYYGVVAIVFIIAVLLIISIMPIPGNIKFLVVSTGSMDPTIKTGSLIFVAPQPDYKIGDIITFTDSQTKKTVTHRINEMQVNSGVPYYVTKGDANNAIDQGLISKDKIAGRVIFSIPFLGYVVEFIKKPIGFLLAILIPVILIIIDQAIKIKKELEKDKKQTDAKG